jgi:hypothetical protein
MTLEPDNPAGGTLSKAIADHFVDALHKRAYVFLSDDELGPLRTEIRAFAARYEPAGMPREERESLLSAIDQYVPQLFVNRHFDFPAYFSSAWDVEGTYLKFRDLVNTFKWQLWQALMRRPFTPEQLQRRQAQHDWLRRFIATVPAREGDGYPPGIVAGNAHAWASRHLEEALANPLGWTYDPMPDSQFELFKKLMDRSAVNGLAMSIREVPVRALGARAHASADPNTAYAYPFDIELPFDDEVISIHGGGDGGGPHLVFASNRQFRGQDVYLDTRSWPLFDLIKGPITSASQSRDNVQNAGDIAYDDVKADVTALHGARLAKLAVANWFEADRMGNADLRKLISENSQMSISVKNLPPENGLRRVGETDPRLFIAVQNREGRLAVMDLRTREFGLHLVSRLRPAD